MAKKTSTTSKKKATKKSETKAAVSHSHSGNITEITVRMYRAGTGDFFILFFKKKGVISFKMMIDCGGIHGSKAEFEPLIKDLKKVTNGSIDLLVVTHEHADHINGFEKGQELFKDIVFKKVWFAWTESKEDKLANDLRKNHTKIKLALTNASSKLSELRESKYYSTLYKDEHNGHLMAASQDHFIDSIMEISELNMPIAKGSKIPTMADLLTKYNVIKGDTEVEFLSPGDLRADLKDATGISFFVLGPPRSLESLKSETGKEGEAYEKREKPSKTNFAFINALTTEMNEHSDISPFDRKYLSDKNNAIKSLYNDKESKWRTIEQDWLNNAGSLALKFQSSVNNTSLALAIQFEDSEKVLLFPGDAEFGNWQSWHDGIEWKVKRNSKTVTVNAEYLLNNTVFYKVGHHMSQNGSDKKKGIEMMTNDEMAAMVTLDFKKINTCWLNTMPNDIIGSELIKKSKGKMFFAGDRKKIIPNIETHRVSMKKSDLSALENANKAYDTFKYIDYTVKG